MVKHLRRPVAGAIALLLSLAVAVPAFAFPTSSTVYPSYSGCTTTLSAYAGIAYGTGYETVNAFHTDASNCASTVAVYARALVLGYGTVFSGPVVGDYQASANVAVPDYYYGYALGSMYVGGTPSAYESTLSVHP